MNTIQENLRAVRQQIANIVQECERPSNSVSLIAVSKTKSVSEIEQVLQAGQLALGENYVQEGIDKIHHFAQTSWAQQIEWHFIGSLQTNKTRLVAEHFSWMQTLDRFAIAQRLNDQRPLSMPPLNILIQINISEEQSKSGIMLADLSELASSVVKLPRLKLRGIMAVPAPHAEPTQQLMVLQKMQQAFADLQQHYPSVDTLSMGMSNDIKAAIIAGSTMVRIGSAIFGARHKADNQNNCSLSHNGAQGGAT